MHTYTQSFIQQLFTSRQLRPVEYSLKQLDLARQAVVAKKKLQTNIHSILFCKSFINGEQNFMGGQSLRQKQQLQDEKEKYITYMRRNYCEKLPEQFQTMNKLKRAIRQKKEQVKAKNKTDNEEQTKCFKRSNPTQKIQKKVGKSIQKKQKKQDPNKKIKKSIISQIKQEKQKQQLKQGIFEQGQNQKEQQLHQYQDESQQFNLDVGDLDQESYVIGQQHNYE